MSWTLFAQICFLIILVYLVVRALVVTWLEHDMLQKLHVARKLEEDKTIKRSFTQ